MVPRHYGRRSLVIAHLEGNLVIGFRGADNLVEDYWTSSLDYSRVTCTALVLFRSFVDCKVELKLQVWPNIDTTSPLNTRVRNVLFQPDFKWLKKDGSELPDLIYGIDSTLTIVRIPNIPRTDAESNIVKVGNTTRERLLSLNPWALQDVIVKVANPHIGSYYVSWIEHAYGIDPLFGYESSEDAHFAAIANRLSNISDIIMLPYHSDSILEFDLFGVLFCQGP